MLSSSLWQRFQQYFLYYRDLGFSLDISRMKFPDDFFGKMQPKIDHAFAGMQALETGAIANPSEKRMVGHYRLRNTVLAPTPEIRAEIEQTIERIQTFAAEIHSGKIGGRTSVMSAVDPHIRVSHGEEPADDQFSLADSDS